MSTVLIAPGPDPFDVRIVSCPASARLRARLRAASLDERLAGGANPDAAVELSIRARALHSSRSRHRLACRWRRLAQHAIERPHPFDATIPLARSSIQAAAHLIERLATLLASDAPLEISGIARAEMLMRSPDSPIWRHSGGDLAAALMDVLDALGVEPLSWAAGPA